MKNYLRDTLSRLGGTSRTAWPCPDAALTRSPACLAVVPLRAGRRQACLALVAVLGSLPAGRLTAQTFTTLYSFTALNQTTLPNWTNSDGANPYAGLITNSSGNTLYGTASGGGSSGNGTVFAVRTDGTGFTNLHNFTGSDGSYPQAGLVLSGNTLYGTANTVFKVNTDGTGFTNLNVGAGPGGLILSGNTLYGTAVYGGSSGWGTVFKVNTDGTGFTNLHSFTGDDGAWPQAGLVLSGNTLYGTTYEGGSSGYGTVFAISTDGRGFTNLHSFTGTDGSGPYAGLIVSGNTLYGTTELGGNWDRCGTVFAVNTDGAGFTVLHNFACTDGASPQVGLILSGNTLYGTATSGGSSGYGTVFSLSFRPQLTITPSGTNIILSWPTNVAGFDYTGYTLQSTTNLLSPAAWVTNSPAPVVIAGQNTVTNPLTGAQRFFRLIH